jgi:alpha-glucosidase
MSWWREGVLYQIYPRSFSDSNGDGVGDLRGIVEHLDYLSWLGVDGLWLNPIHPSPNVDWGYDVADYYGVHPELGTLDDLDELVSEAGRLGIRVLLDLVPNHTSDQHPWFDRRPDWYVWADEVPNNWRAMFGGGSAWTWDSDRGRYYLHNFAKEQPDLDWRNPEVRAEFQRVIGFWFDRGIAGFRIDVANGLVKDRDLRDDPPATAADPEHIRRIGLRPVYSRNRPETHEILRSWRQLADRYEPERVLLGEVYVLDLERWARYFGSGEDELHLAFNFALVHTPLDPDAMRAIVDETERVLPAAAWPAWTGSNHDQGRLATRWAQGHEDKLRCALLILLTLRGTPVLYYGDELGLADGVVPPRRTRDVARPSRDSGRTPIPWMAGDGGWRNPWLPLSNSSRNVADQKDDPASTLSFVRDLIALRRRTKQLRTGRYASLASPPGTWGWLRDHDVAVAVNLSAEPRRLPLNGHVAIATRPGREGEHVAASLELDANEGVVLVGARVVGVTEAVPPSQCVCGHSHPRY